MERSVIVLEFNELTPSLMDRFMAEGVLPNFSRLRRESIVAVSDAEEDPPALNPWVQWVTIHTGKSFSEHQVFHLADGAAYAGPRVWDMVSDAGKPVWVCGSMNSSVRGGTINGAVLPDPWAMSATPHPASLGAFFDVVSRFVQEHSSAKTPVGPAAMLRFGRFMVANGLSLKTVRAAFKQLATERPQRMQWARAFILDRLQRDVFKHQYRKLKPAFATLFSNSTAHFQHFHWRNMEPDAFALKPTDSEQQRFAGAIREGYVRMDEAVGEVLALAGPQTSIVLATALSQQPLVRYDTDGGKQLFRPLAHQDLTELAGIETAYTYEPVMSEKFNLVFENEAAAVQAKAKIDALELEGAPLMRSEVAAAKLVLVCAVNRFPSEGARATSRLNGRSAAFDALFYPIEGVKSGMHHRDGMLWIRTPEHRHLVMDRKVLLREIAPTLLHLCDVPIPEGAFAFGPIAEVLAPDPMALAA